MLPELGETVGVVAAAAEANNELAFELAVETLPKTGAAAAGVAPAELIAENEEDSEAAG